MKRLLSVLLAMLLLFSATSIGFTAQAKGKTACYTVKYAVQQDYDYAVKVLNIVNAERKKKKCKPLKLNKQLTEAAMQRAAELAVYYSHKRPDGTVCNTVHPSVNGENILQGLDTPEEAMRAWMASPGHRANILRKNFKSVGIGCVRVGDIYYWVQNFSNSSKKAYRPKGKKRKVKTVKIKKKDAYFFLTAPNDPSYQMDQALYYHSHLNGVQFGVTVTDTKGDFLSESGLPSLIGDYTYSCSDHGILQVNADGSAVIVGTGTVTVTAYSAKLKQTVSQEFYVERDNPEDYEYPGD